MDTPEAPQEVDLDGSITNLMFLEDIVSTDGLLYEDKASLIGFIVLARDEQTGAHNSYFASSILGLNGAWSYVPEYFDENRKGLRYYRMGEAQADLFFPSDNSICMAYPMFWAHVDASLATTDAEQDAVKRCLEFAIANVYDPRETPEGVLATFDKGETSLSYVSLIKILNGKAVLTVAKNSLLGTERISLLKATVFDTYGVPKAYQGWVYDSANQSITFDPTFMMVASMEQAYEYAEHLGDVACLLPLTFLAEVDPALTEVSTEMHRVRRVLEFASASQDHSHTDLRTVQKLIDEITASLLQGEDVGATSPFF